MYRSIQYLINGRSGKGAAVYNNIGASGNSGIVKGGTLQLTDFSVDTDFLQGILKDLGQLGGLGVIENDFNGVFPSTPALSKSSLAFSRS